MLRCSRCGKTEEQRSLEPPMPTGINHPEHCMTKSFYLHGNSKNGKQDVPFCPECHREIELERAIKTMDQYAKKHGEDKLAKMFGL